MKQKSIAKLQQQVADFNEKVKPGDTVKMRRDTSSPWENVTVRHPATILGGHSAVAWFNEVRGCYSLDFVKY